MITNICIENFKPIKKAAIQTTELNIMMGLNGMGKTSFIQALLLLMQSSDKLKNHIIELNGSLVKIGLGRNALYQFAEDEHITLGITIDGRQYVWKFDYQADEDELNASDEFAAVSLDELRKKSLQYVSADRIGPQEVYAASKTTVSDQLQLGYHGEYAAHFINVHGNTYTVPEAARHPNGVSEKLLAQVTAWLGEISPGVSLNTEYLPGVNKIVLDYQFAIKHGKTRPFTPQNVGFGISYILPVLLSLLTPDNDKIVVIENPESHIHPRGQAELGKLIALSAMSGSQLFVETHSDHIINGIRVAVKEKLIEKEKVNILFFDKVTTPKEQYAKITPIKVDENGSLSDYPDNFLDEWSNQLSKLI